MSLDHPETPRRAAYVPPAPDDDGDAGFDTVGFLMRRKWLIVFGVIVGLSLGYLYYVKQPAVYQSAGRVLVQKQSAQLPISGGVTMDPSIHRRDPLANDMFKIRSPQIVKPAVEENDLRNTNTLRRSADPVKSIINSLTVNRVEEGADILEVRFTGQDPEDCARIVDAVLRSYTQDVRTQFVNSSNQIVKYLGDAKDELDTKLKQAEAEYRTFRKETELLVQGNSAVNPFAAQIESTRAKLTNLRLEQTAIQSKLDAIDAALQHGGSREALQLMIDQTARAGDGDASSRSALSSVTERMFPLLLEEMVLLERHGPDHPKVREIRLKIDATQKMLEDLGIQRGGTGRRKVDFLQIYIDSLKLELATNATEQASLEALLAQQGAEAKALTDVEIKHGDLIAQKARLQEMFNTVLTKLEDVSLAADSEGYRAEVVAAPGRGWQVSPNFPKIMTVGAILGALCGLLLGYVVEAADQSFKSPQEISQLLGLHIIGHCPLITAVSRPRDANGNASVDPSVVAYYKPKSRGAEAFRAIRTALYFSTRGAGHKVIQVTSPHPGDGKSTLSSNLAVTIAQSGKKVIIVDADFRRPRVHKIFGINNEVGMSTAIAGDVDISDAIQQTPVANLDCLTCGAKPDNPSELLTSARFEELLSLLKEKYDFVLVDTPPVLAVTDPSAVAARVDGVLLTIRVNNKSRLDAARATEMLAQLEANILGVVVNGVDGKSRGYGYAGAGYRAGHIYGYGYGYGYGMSDEAAHPSHAKYFADDREAASLNGHRQRTRS